MLNGFEGAIGKAAHIQSEIAKAALLVKSNAPKIQLPGAAEAGLAKKTGKKSLNMKVAAIDSGMLTYSFRYLDIAAIRPAGVVFDYAESRLVAHEYYPSKNPPFQSFAWSALEYIEAAGAASIARLNCEVGMAARIAEEKKPGMILIDGSLVPLISDKPKTGSPLEAEYGKLIGEYKRLFTACEENSITLVGFAKDSRGRRFVQSLVKAGVTLNALERASDLSIMQHVLDGGERSVALPYAQEQNTNPILADFGQWGGKAMVFYLKPSDLSQVYRIEFLKTPAANEDTVASDCLALCMFGKRYQYPPPLIEADMMASAKARDIKIFEAEASRIGGDKKVRDDRPFR